MVLLFDGFDEADPQGGSDVVFNTAMQLLHQQLIKLPDTVRFIITTRPDGSGNNILAALQLTFPGLLKVQPSMLHAPAVSSTDGPGSLLAPASIDMSGATVSEGGKAPAGPALGVGDPADLTRTASMRVGAGGGVRAERVMLVTTLRDEVFPSLGLRAPSHPAHEAEDQAATLDTLYTCYSDIWDARTTSYSPQQAGQVRELLSVLLAAQEPLAMALLQRMGLAECVSLLPGYGVLFFESEHHLYMLHKSLADWLDQKQNSLNAHAVNVETGHTILARHLSLAAKGIGSMPGAYALKHLVRHLLLSDVHDEQDLQWTTATLDAVLGNFGFLEAVMRAGHGLLLVLDLTRNKLPSRFAKQVAQWLRALVSATQGVPADMAQRAKAEDRLGLLAAAAAKYEVDHAVWQAQQDFRTAPDRARTEAKHIEADALTRLAHAKQQQKELEGKPPGDESRTYNWPSHVAHLQVRGL